MKERRVTNRFDCSHLVHYQGPADGSIGMITDLSLDGARLRGQTRLSAGGRLSVQSLDSNAAIPIEAEICWYDEEQSEAGLRFCQPVGEVLRSWVGEALEGHMAYLIQRREEVRVPVRIPTVVSEGGLTCQGVLVDLSCEGALLRCTRLWPTGTRLTLTIAALGSMALEAEIVGGRCGQDGWDYSLQFTRLGSAESRALDAVVTRSAGLEV